MLERQPQDISLTQSRPVHRRFGAPRARVLWLLLAVSGCGDDGVSNTPPSDAGDASRDAALSTARDAEGPPVAPSMRPGMPSSKPTATARPTAKPMPTEPATDGAVPREASVPDAAASVVEASVPVSSSALDASPDASSAVSLPDAAEAGPDGAVNYEEMCSALPAAPISFEEIPGFTRSEDFVFDELGNYVGIDTDSNLVRISKSGERELWAPGMGYTAGMGILPDGSVVICDVGEGALKRVYPNGYIQILLGGLLYPNGMDIGPDGYIYVAENNAGRVRRVDPDSGEFTFVAIGLFGSNGVAFSSDPNVFYVGSFEGSGVYKVVLSAPGELGTATVFARPNGSTLPEPTVRCPEQQAGVSCEESGTMAGECQPFANIFDCLPTDPCPDLEDGQSCDFPKSGTCNNGACVGACDAAALWDSCDLVGYYVSDGVCAPSEDGSLECRPPRACDQLAEGDVCQAQYYNEPGVCVAVGSNGELNCVLPQPCDGLAEGDTCQTNSGAEGTCAEQSYYYYAGYVDFGGLTCQPLAPCQGSVDGDACVNQWGEEGTCGVVDYGGPVFTDAGGNATDAGGPVTDAGAAPLSCVIPGACDGLALGDACTTDWQSAGVCSDDGGGGLYCQEPQPCDGLVAGDTCTTNWGTAGVCNDDYGYMHCQELPPCDGLAEGDVCMTGSGEGTCVAGASGLDCDVPAPCDGHMSGDTCSDAGSAGICVLFPWANDSLHCMSDPCLNEGDSCSIGFGLSGVCVAGSPQPTCDLALPCDGLNLGDTCEDGYYGTGICSAGEFGPYCRMPQPCDGLEAGDACEGNEAGSVCVLEENELECRAPAPCDGLADGDVCQDYFGAGTCGVFGPSYGYPVPPSPSEGDGSVPSSPYPPAYTSAYPPSVSVVYTAAAPVPLPPPEPSGSSLTCLPPASCDGLPEGSACLQEYGFGICTAGVCGEQTSPGGIDGLGVDVCGNVYASEYVNGYVWRISPAGEIELLTTLPSSWIPNIKWGRDLGGFSSDVMYVADRDQARLFGISVGAPSAPEFYTIGAP